MEELEIVGPEENNDFIKKLEEAEFNSGVIFFNKEVTDDSCFELLLKLRELRRRKHGIVKININSPGGSLDSLHMIIDEIDRMKKEGIVIETVVMGSAFSAAACMLLLGSDGHRFAGKYSTIMFHPVSFGVHSDYAENQKSATDFFNELNTRLIDFILNAITWPTTNAKNQFKKKINKSLWLTAQEALKQGVINDIR